MSKREFYRTVLQFEILSEGPIPLDITMTDLVEECVSGDYSGTVKSKKVTRVSGARMARLLDAQGSEPEFFQLDENGRDLGEDE